MRTYPTLLTSLCIAAVAAAGARAQAGPPSTDIFLAPVRQQGASVTIGTPVNITNRPGYDNQPSFTPDGRAVLFTSIRGDGQSDIYRYDVRARTTRRVTSTPEREYSPTVYGDGTRFSVIRVEADSAQRLWSFKLDGSDPRVLFPNIKPVGYHAWVDSSMIALFLLGRPNALVLAKTNSDRVDTLGRDIGRSLLPLPRGGGFSFVQHAKDSSWVLTAVEVRRGPNSHSVIVMPLTKMPAGADYIAWLAPAVALSGSGSQILLWRGRSGTEWNPIKDLSRFGLTHISRLALSPDHRWLAIVAEK